MIHTLSIIFLFLTTQLYRLCSNRRFSWHPFHFPVLPRIATWPRHISDNVKSPRNSHSGDFSYVRERIRTPDTLVRSQVLYPAELRTHILFFRRLCSPPPSSFVRLPGTSPSPYNAGDRNRTGTVFLQQDFKSCASASSATPARFPFSMGPIGLEPMTLCL